MFFFLLSLSQNRIRELLFVISKSERLESVSYELTELYRNLEPKYFSHFRKIFRRFIPPRTIEDLEDGYFYGWETILKKRHLFDLTKTENPEAWIKTILEHSIRNNFTKQKNLRNRIDAILLPTYTGDEENDSIEKQFNLVKHEVNNPIVQYNKNELQKLVDFFLENDDYVKKDVNISKVFKLVVLEGKKSTDVANELQIANSTITKYKSKVLERLRIFLQVNGWEEL